MYEDLFQVKSNNLTPETGRILIASPLLEDYHFSRSVILMINHGEDGDMGLVLNKGFRNQLSLKDLLPEEKGLPPVPVFKGGPVGRNIIFFIHNMEEIEDSLPIGKGIFLNGNFEQMINYIKSGKPTEDKVRFYLGYAGWVKDQLEAEIGEDTWIISEPDNKRLFMNDQKDLWHNSLDDMGEPYRTWAKYPSVPSLN